jgi:hypothetical protein
LENVRKTPASGVPVSLQGVDADISTGLSHIGVEDLGQEEALRRLVGEVSIDDELAPENASVKRCVL